MYSRRDFLQTSALVAGSLALTQSLPAGEGVATGKSSSSRPSLMKLSLAAYSFNRVLPNRTKPAQGEPKMTLEDFVDYCAELGLPACELTGYYFPQTVTPEYLNSLKLRAFKQGLDISGTAIGNDFCVAEGRAMEEQLQMCRDWVDYAALLGAPVIRIFAGKVPKGESEAVALQRCIAGLRESLDYAAKKGVMLALENHGGITDTPEQMMRIIDPVKDHPNFGVNFDSGNFRTADPYGDLAKIAPLAVNAQIKVMISPGGKEEPADLKRIVNILKDAGYRGYVVLEYEEEADPKQEIPRYLDELRTLIG